jgi:HEAT repeat protein
MPALIRVTPRNPARPVATAASRKTVSPANVAAALRATTQTTASTVGGLPTARDLYLAMRDPNSSLTVQTLLARLKQAGNASLPILEKALKSESPELSQMAATALCEIGTAEAAHLLLETIAEETDPSWKESLEAILAAWSDPRAAEVFVGALHNNRDAHLRQVIAGVLAPLLTGEMAEPLLQQFSKAGADTDFRLGVAETLSLTQSEAVASVLASYLNSIAGDEAIRLLGDAAARIGNRAVTAAILNAYRRIGNNENLDTFLKIISKITNPDSVSAFAEALGRPDDQTNTWKLAAAGLSRFGTPDAIDALLKEARNAPGDSERQQVLVHELSSVGNPDSLQHLVNAYTANQADATLAQALAQAILNCGEAAILKQFGDQLGQEYIAQFKKLLEPPK